MEQGTQAEAGEGTDRASPSLPTDVQEIGLNTRLAFALPLLRTLVQAVAESEGDWSFLNAQLAAGPWLGVARRWDEDNLVISTNHGDRTTEPYPSPVHEILLSHGFAFVPEHEGYRQFVRFETDDAFESIARLMIGTFMHAWRASPGDYVRVELNISLPPDAGSGPEKAADPG